MINNQDVHQPLTDWWSGHDQDGHQAPALSPQMATSSGFPPRCAMLSRTHCRASTWKWTHWYCCVMNSNFGYRTGPSTKGNWVKILTNLVPQQRVIGSTDDDKPGPSILDFLKPCQNQGWAPPKDQGGSSLSQRPPCNWFFAILYPQILCWNENVTW